MSQSLLCCHPEHILSRKMERKQRYHSECFIFFRLISRVIPTPDSHLLLYTSPLTATPKLLVTYIVRDRFSFALQIHKHRFRLFSEVQPPPRVVNCALLVENSPRSLHSQCQSLLSQQHHSTSFRSYGVGEFSEDDLRALSPTEDHLCLTAISQPFRSIPLPPRDSLVLQLQSS